MRYLALASDYDNTLAMHGSAPPDVVAGLQELRRSGRRLILVTGRELPDLLQVFPQAEMFDRVVAENGALLYRPDDRSETLLCEPWSEKFVRRLHECGIPVSAGRGIVATVQPHETTVLRCIREFGLELQVIFNREAVMVLPSGVNKASGLLAALNELQLSPHNLVAVGDGENDHAFIDACECAVAVANAVPSLRERADFVTPAAAGAGVLQVIEALLADDFAAAGAKLRRHDLDLGVTAEGATLRLPPYGDNVLIAGTSGGGKSTLATGLFEQIGQRGYQYCIIDPEGDYDGFQGVITLGSPGQAPALAEVLELLADSQVNVAVNMLGIALDDRPAFFQTLMASMTEMRARLGRPHWMLIDEAHHLMPDTWAPAAEILPEHMYGLLMITVHPNRLSRALLQNVGVLIAIGKAPAETVGTFAAAADLKIPARLHAQDLCAGEALAWLRSTDEFTQFMYQQPSGARKRHQRKYAEGDLGKSGSFYFRGPNGSLNLRAQNLRLFMQIGDGVDAATWLHHLHAADYSRWFREFIKDEELARATHDIERDAQLSAQESRERIRAEIELRYTDSA